MTRVFRTSVLSILAAAALAGLGGCSDGGVDGMLTALKNADVDGSGTAGSPEEALRADRKKVDVLLSTATDIAVGKGGLAENIAVANPKLSIEIVDPLTLGRHDDDRPPLDARPGAYAYLSEAEIQAQRALPDIPVGADTPAARAVSARPVAAQRVVEVPLKPVQVRAEAPRTETAGQTAGKMIQVGSFSSRQGAEAAWAKVAGMYEGMDRLKPVYEPVTNAQGRTLVRLRIGPVKNDVQARALCEALGVVDDWCARGG